MSAYFFHFLDCLTKTTSLTTGSTLIAKLANHYNLEAAIFTASWSGLVVELIDL